MMQTYLIALVVYLLGGYVMLALIARYAPGDFDEAELLGWCAWWPIALLLALILIGAELWGRLSDKLLRRRGQS